MLAYAALPLLTAKCARNSNSRRQCAIAIYRQLTDSANWVSSIDIMACMIRKVHFAAMVGVLSAGLLEPCASPAQTFELDSTKGLQPHDVTVEAVTYQGRKAVRVIPAAAADAELVAPKNGEGGGTVVLPGTSFHNGTIEVDVVGKPRAGATSDARGFVGVAFRVAAEPSKYECVYIRPTNGRADDQVRRNHSTQYISMPEYEWSRLRREAPGRYESYVDLAPGEWTKIKIEVSGVKVCLGSA
jgi:hypothetical protein